MCESRPMFIFNILLGYSLMSFWAENLLHSRRFWPKFYSQNSTYFHILFPCIFIITWSNSDLWRHQSVKFLFPLVQKVFL